MYAVKSSSRALLIALVPLAAVHLVLMAMALLATQATTPDASLPIQQVSMPAPDRILTLYVARLMLDGALLFCGHLLLQQRAIFSRTAYAVMGGTATALSCAIAICTGLLLLPPSSGTEITFSLLPTIAGTVAGFLYGQFAGVAKVASRPLAPEGDTSAGVTFDGPVRVRTSVAAVAIAASLPAALTAVLSVGLTPIWLPSRLIDGPSSIVTAAIPAQLFIMLLVATVVPSAIFVLATHHIARAFHRNGGLEYAIIGGVIAVLCAFGIAPFMLIYSVAYMLMPALLYGAIMGALYRRFAGIEPLPLPEALLAADKATLVSADHPSRQQHSVIFID